MSRDFQGLPVFGTFGPNKRFSIDEGRIYFALSLMLVLFSLSVIWFNKYPPQTDFPYHLVRFHMALHFWEAKYRFADRAVLSFFPTPYISADYLAFLFGQFVSVLTAGKFILMMYIVLMGYSLVYLSRVFDKVQNPFSLFGFLFVFNWNFNMGFIEFILGIPFFLLSLGYWWKHKEQFTPTRLVVLAVLVFFVYLSHPYTICFLIFVLGILSVYFGRKQPRVLLGMLAFVPSVALLLVALARDVPSSGVEHFGAFAIVSLSRKLAEIFGKELYFWSSYESWWDKRIVVIAGLVVVAASVAQLVSRARDRQRMGLLVGMVALFALYLVLPDHLVVPDAPFVAERVLIFLALLAVFVPQTPRRAIVRLGVASLAFLLAATQIGLVFADYRKVNGEYADLDAAIKHIPDNKRLVFWSDKELSSIGNIPAIPHFGGYYYIERAGAQIPLSDLWDFLAPLRMVQLKDPPSANQGIAATLTLGCDRAGEGGWLILLVDRKALSPVKNPEEYGCVHKASYGKIAIYQARNTVDPSRNAPAWFASPYDQTEYWKRGFLERYDYLLLYGSQTAAETLQMKGFDLVFSRNRAYLLKRASVR